MLRLAGTLAEALEARELTDLYERSSDRSSVCWGEWRTPASRSTGSSSRACAPSSRQSCDELVGRIQAHAGEEFNVNSTPQLREVLFEKLGWPR